MSFRKYFLILTIVSIPVLLLAQKDIPILTSICVQNAYTNELVSGARVVIEELDRDDKVFSTDTLGGTVFISTYFKPNHKYRLRVRKEGFHFKDTVIIPSLTSRSRKQRLGLPLYPEVCYYIKGAFIDVGSSSKIKTGKLLIKSLSDSKKTELNIKNGYYKYCGQCNHQYELKSIVEGYLDRTEVIELKSKNCYTPREQTMKLDMAVTRNYDKAFFEGAAVFVPKFTFIGNSLNLSIQGEQELKRLIKFLKQESRALISISIRAQSFPERSLNRKLAENRARLIERKLTKAGIAAYRYLLICKGKVEVNYRPINKNQQIILSLRE
ncbi:hypothetical protein OAK19_03815 [Aureispira]|nr:hypothetical protein [Aureispira sp.]